MIGPTCPKCQRIHVAGDVIAVGKFQRPPGGYRVRFDPTSHLYATRGEAQAALCAERMGAAS